MLTYTLYHANCKFATPSCIMHETDSPCNLPNGGLIYPPAAYSIKVLTCKNLDTSS